MASVLSRVKNSIPNTITCLNLFSGCVACVMALEARYEWALIFVIISAVFDFFDGLFARLLHAYTAIGKDLDSLADTVSFGLVPSLLVFSVLRESPLTPCTYVPYLAFLISVFSALRLAKFNNDSRQTTSFVGLPTPANALFWGAYIVGALRHECASFLLHPWTLLTLVLVFSALLVSELPMFSLKVKCVSLRQNKIRFLFLVISVLLLCFLGISGFAAVILWYILLSVILAVCARSVAC